MASKSRKDSPRGPDLAGAAFAALRAGRQELETSFQWTYNHLRHTIVPSSPGKAKAGAAIDGIYDATREAMRAFRESYRGGSADDKHPDA